MTASNVLQTTVTAALSLLLAACGASEELPGRAGQEDCPGEQILICTGGTVSKTGGIRDREPRVCECEDPERTEN